MNGSKGAVFDSNIVIYLSKGYLDFNAVSAAYDRIYISAITYIECLGFNFSTAEEQILIEQLLSHFEIIQTNMLIAEQVVIYRKKRKIKIPDAIILASAKTLNADLVTVNNSDYRNLDSDVLLIVPTLLR